MCERTQHPLMCIITLGLFRNVLAYAIFHNVYQSIGGSSVMCERTQYAIMCIITMGVRRGCVRVRNVS